MPQISTQYPGNLEAIFGQHSLVPAEMAINQFQQAEQNNQINQAQALQDFFQNEQLNPLEVTAKRLANDTTQAQLPGIIANSSLQQDKAAVSRDSLPNQKLAINKKLLSEMSADDASMIDNMGQQFTQLGSYLKSGRPLPQGFALPPELQGKSPDELIALGKQMIAHSKDFLKQQMITDRMLGLQQLRNAGKLANGGNKSNAPKIPTKTIELANYFQRLAYEASDNGDDAKAEELNTIAENYRQQWRTEQEVSGAARGAGSGVVNKGDLIQNPIKVPPLNSPHITKKTGSTGKTVVRTGKTKDGRKVIQYSDGSIEYVTN